MTTTSEDSESAQPVAVAPLSEWLGVGAEALPLQVIANAVAKHVPIGFVVSLHMENGAAWVELTRGWRKPVDLPDAADKTLAEQLNDALLVARGWEAPNMI